MANRRSKLTRRAVERIAAEWHKKQPAWLGDDVDTQVVETGIPGVYYARLANGKVVEVHNALSVPPRFDLHVQIAENRHHPGIWQIIRILEDYDEPAGAGEIGYHHAQHEEEGGDRLSLNRKQITRLTVRVLDGSAFTVKVFGGTVRTNSGIVLIGTQTVDLSAQIVTAGAKFVNIEADQDGLLSLHAGAVFGSPLVASASDYPVPDPGKYRIASILFYEGQTTLADADIDVPLALEASAFGDMQKADYDADNNGIVDQAEDSQTLGGVLPAGFVKRYPGKSTAPTASDDAAAGYEVWGIWGDDANNKAYICLDNTNGAAVWLEIGAATGGGGDIRLVMQPGVNSPPVPVETPDGTDWVYYEA